MPKFKLQRSLSGDFSNTEEITLGKDTESYTDQGLEKNTQYFYRILAFNSNVSSAYSATANASTNDALLPPTDLKADPIKPTQIDISWKDNSIDEDKFVLERSKDKNDFSGATIINIDIDATSYSDTGMETGNIYWYRIKAMKGELSSSYSNKDSAEVGIYTALIDEIKSGIIMYPNPSSGSTVYLKLERKFEKNIDLKIISYSGQVVKHFQNLQQNANLEIEFDIQNLRSGVYIVELETDSIQHLKLIHDN